MTTRQDANIWYSFILPTMEKPITPRPYRDIVHSFTNIGTAAAMYFMKKSIGQMGRYYKKKTMPYYPLHMSDKDENAHNARVCDMCHQQLLSQQQERRHYDHTK